MDYLAGIDLGSTSLKCVIYDLAGNIVASGTRPTERQHMPRFSAVGQAEVTTTLRRSQAPSAQAGRADSGAGSGDSAGYRENQMGEVHTAEPLSKVIFQK